MQRVHFDRSQLVKGIRMLARTVLVTYGPTGKTVLMDRPAGIITTKDGATVARELEFSHPVQNIGCQLARNASLQVNNQAGDGTTTVICILDILIQEGNKRIVAGVNRREFLQGIQMAGAAVTNAIPEVSQEILVESVLASVATVACNGDEKIGKMLAEACFAVGKEGALIIEDGLNVDPVLEFRDGVVLEMQPLHFGFKSWDTPGEGRIMEGVQVALIDQDLTSFEDVKALMESAGQRPQNELLVIARSVVVDALNTMVLNNGKDVVKCCALAAPGRADQQPEQLQDLAALAGTIVVDPQRGQDVRKWDEQWFGSMRKVTVKDKHVVFETYPEAEQDIRVRVQQLERDLEKLEDGYDRDQMQKRIANLSGGLALIKVGGWTEAAMKERRARIEDALAAVQGALAEGVMPGGGVAYIVLGRMSARPVMTEAQRQGWDVVMKALSGPFRRLAGTNATEQDITSMWTSDHWVGWDARKGMLRDLRLSPSILDPANVVRTVIQVALSAGTMVLSTDVVVLK